MEKIKLWFTDNDKRRIFMTVISGISLAISLGGWLKSAIPFDIAWVSVILCGIPIVFGAVNALINEHDIKADVLVSMALLGSLFIGEWFAAGEVAFIMQIGSILEDVTAAKARAGIEKLIKLTPKTARIRRNGKEQIVQAEDVHVGDTVIVLAGETVPVDGIIVSGNTAIDQSVMTGESIPVDKTTGDDVTSGTINQYGTFEMEVTKEEKDSSLQRMIQIAKEADANKAPIVSLADKWATWMVIISFLISVITWLATGELIRAVTVLVVFCPCAFILATPTAIMAGIGNATKYGILVRSGDALERLSKIKYVAFDKTGTLTNGTPKVVAIKSLTDNYKEDDILRIAASVEKYSEHPLGQAICRTYESEHKLDEKISDFEIIAGQGVQCVINGKVVFAGKSALLEAEGVEANQNQLDADKKYLKEGATVIYVSMDKEIIGMIALADTLRSDSKDMIKNLKEEGVEPILLTGDNEDAAKHIAAEVGISNVRANLLPENKMKIIKKYMSKNKNICMIGDGINDALALSISYAGIAMGGIGSDIAVESSDAVLLNDDIKRIPYLLFIADKTMKKVSFNIIFSMGLNFIAVALAVTGVLNPIWGALVHNLGSVFVVVNSSLLLMLKEPEKKGQ
ncbi:heavy metal translocating P-type ATPase [Clostridium sp. BJN0013]|uniref:heavy metal translocating P-type ATPase n=1 Tax=Clostridium sp. BJN0013 TaxID=3236840 RepID=UPI0034C6678F